uniref:Uncharacterized protein n=1 Tax=Anopheles atroparvus TaxID=41427 RepID=A0AAG5DTQ4_ANOAO
MKSMGWTNKETLQDLDLELVSRMQRQLEEENRFLKRFSNCCSRCVCQCVSNSLEQPGAGGSAGAGTGAGRAKYHSSTPPATAPGPQPTSGSHEPPVALQDSGKRVPRLCHQQQQGSQQQLQVQQPTTTTQPGRRNGRAPPTRNCMITGGVELVPLLAKRRSQPRPISLGTTDVTKIDKYTSNGSLTRRADDRYLTDLCNQMNQKQRKVETVRAMEFETSRQHFETWSSFWGRPGHGAPLPNKNKLNLDNLLYKSRR